MFKKVSDLEGFVFDFVDVVLMFLDSILGCLEFRYLRISYDTSIC